jgi:hypothetical protein
MHLIGTVTRIAVLLLTCSAVAFGAKAVSIEKFRIRNQINNWVEESATFKLFTTKTIFEIIDGGATEYIDNGLKKGFFQRLRNSNSAAIELFAEDFGSTENARKMLLAKQTSSSGLQSAGNAVTSSFLMNEIVGGFWACGIVGADYFELTLTGITDRTKAEAEINAFFDYYKQTGTVAKRKQ